MEGVRVSDPVVDPNAGCERAPAAGAGKRSVRSGPARAERDRRVVEGLKGGLAMAEIAGREGISERGLRKYVRTLFARRAPEATGEFVATQMSRLNEALGVSFGAMAAKHSLRAVDRVVKIVRDLDRYQGLEGDARGTKTRHKLLETLNSGAGTDPDPTGAASARPEAQAPAQDGSGGDVRDPPADAPPDPAALDRVPQGGRGSRSQRGSPSSRGAKRRGDPEARDTKGCRACNRAARGTVRAGRSGSPRRPSGSSRWRRKAGRPGRYERNFSKPLLGPL